MLIAIDTSSDYGSIAIGRSADLAGEVLIAGGARHAESLLPALDFLMRSTGIARRDIRGVIAGAGPGSFTGVRVAASTARGLAAGLAVPLYAWSSLAALALEPARVGRVCAVFDARRGEVYAACYDREVAADRLSTIFEPEVMGVDALRERTAGMDVLFTGAGARRYAGELGIDMPPPAHPRASGLLRLTAADPRGGVIETPTTWEPTYLRASGAERGIAG